jgi:hypothetical protein
VADVPELPTDVPLELEALEPPSSPVGDVAGSSLEHAAASAARIEAVIRQRMKGIRAVSLVTLCNRISLVVA